MAAHWTTLIFGVAASIAIGTTGCDPTMSKAGGPPPATTRPVAVVELFTSEGCSSCPPADDAISDLAADAKKDGTLVFPISFHVDYWNRLGWSDRFSDATYSDRQQKYAAVLGDRNVYTPQAVVNGRVGFVGSDREKLKQEIAAALKSPEVATVSFTVKPEADQKHLVVDYKVTGAPDGSVLNLAVVERDLTTKVAAGENGGRTLKHTNVVRAFDTHALTTADSTGQITLKLPADAVLKNVAVVGFVQDEKTMHISGAAAVEMAH
jgi:hypothetical protein